jgi:hypothetical protein
MKSAAQWLRGCDINKEVADGLLGALGESFAFLNSHALIGQC